MLLQEKYADEPWKLLVCCILLNCTTRKQVDKMLDELFERFPNPIRMQASTDEELEEIIRPLGLWRRRTVILRKMSGMWWRIKRQYPYEDVPEEEIARLPGIGVYALDSYRIFHLRDRSRFDSGDKEIARHLYYEGETA